MTGFHCHTGIVLPELALGKFVGVVKLGTPSVVENWPRGERPRPIVEPKLPSASASTRQ